MRVWLVTEETASASPLAVRENPSNLEEKP
jgi:hypothetical protein